MYATKALLASRVVGAGILYATRKIRSPSPSLIAPAALFGMVLAERA
jgi:XapX domain-containing protein